MKIPIKREPQQIALNHLFDIEFKDVMNLDKNYTKKFFSLI